MTTIVSNKILRIMLVMACMFGLSACGFFLSDQPTPDPYAGTIAPHTVIEIRLKRCTLLLYTYLKMKPNGKGEWTHGVAWMNPYDLKGFGYGSYLHPKLCKTVMLENGQKISVRNNNFYINNKVIKTTKWEGELSPSRDADRLPTINLLIDEEDGSISCGFIGMYVCPERASLLSRLFE